MREFKGFQKGVNLGGWLSQCNYTIERYETFITEEDFKTFSSWGLDHIRVPVDYPLLENEDGSLTEHGMGYIQRAIDWCEKYHLNMVLDLHKAPGYFFNNHEEQPFFYDDTLKERFYALWIRLAKAFGKYDFVAFELLNEVTSPRYSKPWNEIAKECIKRIREYAPNTYILIGSYWNNSIDSLKDLDPPYDDKIVYNFHCYDPFLFTHQGAAWSVGMPEDFRLRYPVSKEEYIKEQERLNMFDGFMPHFDGEILDRKFFEWRFRNAIAVAEERNVPLYCGEYGVYHKAKNEDAVKWYQEINAAFEKYKIGRANWSYKQMGFGFVDKEVEDVKDELIKYL